MWLKTQILAEKVKFYEKMYTTSQVNKNKEEEEDMWDHITSLDSNTIEGEWNDNLEKDLTDQEIKSIIDKGATDKSPRSDGLTTECYQAFWPDIHTYLGKKGPSMDL